MKGLCLSLREQILNSVMSELSSGFYYAKVKSPTIMLAIRDKYHCYLIHLFHTNRIIYLAIGNTPTFHTYYSLLFHFPSSYLTVSLLFSLRITPFLFLYYFYLCTNAYLHFAPQHMLFVFILSVLHCAA